MPVPQETLSRFFWRKKQQIFKIGKRSFLLYSSIQQEPTPGSTKNDRSATLIELAEMQNLLASVAGFLITGALIGILQPLAMRIGLVDHPRGHKAHEGEIPLTGGIAMFCGFLFAVLLLDAPLSQYRPLFVGSGLLVIVGILDDFHELPAGTKFVAQIAAALIMALWGGIVISDLGAIFGGESIELGVWSIPFTVFAVVGVINALNMADGIDGLAGCLVICTLGFLSLMADLGGLSTTVPLLLLPISVVAAFLLFNFRFPRSSQARVFMGDAGSMFLGYIVAWFLVALSQNPNAAISPVTALWIFAIPLLDTVSIMLRRILKRRSPFLADREHFHHVLLAAGFNVPTAVAMILALSVAAAGAGVTAQTAGAPDWLVFAGFLALFSLYFWGMRHAFRVVKTLDAWKTQR